jgi:arylsulfatase A-like enzyme
VIRSARRIARTSVLIDIDTLRADRLSCYGSERPTSPALDAFAADGAAVFLDASSTAPWTLPATASMLTGLSPNQHGAVMEEQAIAASVPSLAQLLREAGYETRALTAGGYLLPGFGFDAGFDAYTCRAGWVPDAAEVEALLTDRRSDRPLFLFVHTYMVHAPYSADTRFLDETSRRSAFVGRAITRDDVIGPVNDGKLVLGEGDQRYVENLYEAGIARMDDSLGRVLDAIDRAVPRSHVLVLITSDHGEELFEHGGAGAPADPVRGSAPRPAHRPIPGRPAGRTAPGAREPARHRPHDPRRRGPPAACQPARTVAPPRAAFVEDSRGVPPARPDQREPRRAEAHQRCHAAR